MSLSWQLLVDGKLIEVDNDAKIIYDDLILTNEDGTEARAELHVTLTSEGVIEDVWLGDEAVASHALTAQEIIERLCDE